MVEKAEISIGDKPFKVKTVGWSDENIYVQSVKLMVELIINFLLHMPI